MLSYRKLKKQKRKKYDDAADFSKKRQKLGTKSKATTFTDVSFKSRTLKLRGQFGEGQKLTSKRNLTIEELCSHLKHHNMKVRKDACLEIKDMLKSHGHAVLFPSCTDLLAVLASLIVETEREVRVVFLSCFQIIANLLSQEQFAPSMGIHVAYLRSAFTSLHYRVRFDALAVLNMLLRYYPVLVQPHIKTFSKDLSTMILPNQSQIVTFGSTNLTSYLPARYMHKSREAAVTKAQKSLTKLSFLEIRVAVLMVLRQLLLLEGALEHENSAPTITEDVGVSFEESKGLGVFEELDVEFEDTIISSAAINSETSEAPEEHIETLLSILSSLVDMWLECVPGVIGSVDNGGSGFKERMKRSGSTNYMQDDASCYTALVTAQCMRDTLELLFKCSDENLFNMGSWVTFQKRLAAHVIPYFPILGGDCGLASPVLECDDEEFESAMMSNINVLEEMNAVMLSLNAVFIEVILISFKKDELAIVCPDDLITRFLRMLFVSSSLKLPEALAIPCIGDKQWKINTTGKLLACAQMRLIDSSEDEFNKLIKSFSMFFRTLDIKTQSRSKLTSIYFVHDLLSETVTGGVRFERMFEVLPVKGEFSPLPHKIETSLLKEWVLEFPRLLWKLGHSNRNITTKILKLLTSVGRRGIGDSHAGLLQRLVPFFYTQASSKVDPSKKRHLFGPFSRLSEDLQIQAIDLLFYLGEFHQLMLRALSVVGNLVSLSILQRLLDVVMQSLSKHNNSDEMISFGMSLISGGCAPLDESRILLSDEEIINEVISALSTVFSKKDVFEGIIPVMINLLEENSASIPSRLEALKAVLEPKNEEEQMEQ